MFLCADKHSLKSQSFTAFYYLFSISVYDYSFELLYAITENNADNFEFF